jgi:hypothetical protein
MRRKCLKQIDQTFHLLASPSGPPTTTIPRRAGPSVLPTRLPQRTTHYPQQATAVPARDPTMTEEYRDQNTGSSQPPPAQTHRRFFGTYKQQMNPLPPPNTSSLAHGLPIRGMLCVELLALRLRLEPAPLVAASLWRLSRSGSVAFRLSCPGCQISALTLASQPLVSPLPGGALHVARWRDVHGDDVTREAIVPTSMGLPGMGRPMRPAVCGPDANWTLPWFLRAGQSNCNAVDLCAAAPHNATAPSPSSVLPMLDVVPADTLLASLLASLTASLGSVAECRSAPPSLPPASYPLWMMPGNISSGRSRRLEALAPESEPETSLEPSATSPMGDTSRGLPGWEKQEVDLIRLAMRASLRALRRAAFVSTCTCKRSCTPGLCVDGREYAGKPPAGTMPCVGGSTCACGHRGSPPRALRRSGGTVMGTWEPRRGDRGCLSRRSSAPPRVDELAPPDWVRFAVMTAPPEAMSSVSVPA